MPKVTLGIENESSGGSPDASRGKRIDHGAGTFQPPTISLPKGGGAIRGIGEKFGSNLVTGGGSMSVPIATSPGRSGFVPQLSISYDTAAGNGLFGFGWSISLPSITRKTDKGLPQYLDAADSDVFVLSGAEDLVPVLNPDGTRQRDETTDADFTVHRFRPRIEGVFARIERWTRHSDGEIHWRTISKDNILSVYGKDADSRITDPMDTRHVFSWLICQVQDDKGNAILYDYKREDGIGVDLASACESNRGDRSDIRRTANRYLKRIRYGNRISMLNAAGHRPRFLTQPMILNAGWMFEVIFDYGEHDANVPTPADSGPWAFRDDPFSSYRPGFEVRTTRLCQRVLMFHHFPGEAGVGDNCLVRSTDFTYSNEQNPGSDRNPVYTFLRAVTQTGYQRDGAGYRTRRLPQVEFEYSEPVVQDTVEVVDSASLENLPTGIDGAVYQWTDLHGEGIPGILTEQADAWFYKRNISPISERQVAFAPIERVALKPSLSLPVGAQFMDLAGDGEPDMVVFDGPTPGFYEHDENEGWRPFRPFTSRLNRNTRDPNLKFVDLDGDGHADVLITDDDALVWHPSLAEAGFGPARRVANSLNEETGPRLVFSDGTQSIYLADLSGDGLTDLVRIRNGEVCYWPNLGYGRFGAKVTMDNSPQFDNPDQFDQQRVRLADIDGSGTTDIIYLHRDGVRLYFNQSGNSWSLPKQLNVFPRVDDLVSIVTTDLLGNGTTCLVWSSPLPSDTRPMRYVNLMGGQKPHLLVRTVNNLGAETRVHYAPSTKFYLQDKRDGKPWITRLPFPVHVVERVETFDHISRNRFLTTYAYHHGYFDGEEREFRGFGMVEQKDTEEFAALVSAGIPFKPTNVDAASHVPPVLTRTWFHTGVFLDRERISGQFEREYYREPGLTGLQVREQLLPDTVLPSGLTPEEEREACRALKGSMLRQEVYALDGTPKQEHPYTVSEQNFSVRLEQSRGRNRHAVFLSHPVEAISYHYERNPADPRIQHAITLEVDVFGNVLKEVAIGYGRRQPDLALPLDADRNQQSKILVTYSEHLVTNWIDDAAIFPDDYRTPVPSEARTYELTGYTPTGLSGRFQATDFVLTAGSTLTHIFDSEMDYEDLPTIGRQRRLIEQVRTLYRKDDLSALLPHGQLEPMAIPGESYKLAFTPGLIEQAFQRNGVQLLPTPSSVLGGQAGDRGGYLSSQELKSDGRFPDSDPDDHWWIPSGRMFFSLGTADTAAQELAHARSHFFLPHRTRDPFHTNAVSTESIVTYDAHKLLMVETRDALGSRVSVEANDYRVLQPRLVSDPNRNQTEVVFDTLGLVAGTAIMGKPLPAPVEGDSLAGFVAELTQAQLDGFHDAADPHATAQALLQNATSRVVYDIDRFWRSQLANPLDHTKWLAPYAATLARETHASDPLPLPPAPQGLKIQISFSFSDGFGREIQKKVQAEPGPVVAGGPAVRPRWVGSGWTIFNNKGKPVRQYEPFFSNTHHFEFGVVVGVSPILFYDPLERVVATLLPNNTYEKVVFDPWRQVTWDVNDTVLSDPRTDMDISGYTAGYFASLPASPPAAPWQTWHVQRQGGALGVQEQVAANKAAAHAGTPTLAHFDSLGRPFLTLADNGPDPALPAQHLLFATRVELDVEGNQRAVRDGIEQAGDKQGRIVMRYAYDMLGNRIYQLSMEAGARWMLNDVAGKPIRVWNDRGHSVRTEYDLLRRPLRSLVTGANPADPDQEILTERLVYGEQHPQAEVRNLRGKLYLNLDQAGAVTTESCDFKGNPLRASRRLTNGTQYRQSVNWATVDADHVALPTSATAPLNPVALEAVLVPRLEADAYTSFTNYDAMNRPVLLTTPHTPAMQPSVIRPGYNEAGLLERVDANLRGAMSGGQPVWTPFVANIDYDAKAQRQRIDYGNGVSTFYEYDPLTFRLVHMLTRRNVATFPNDCPQPPPVGWPGCQVQNLHYTFDPVGNITHIRDDAQQTVYFRNKRVEPSAEYTYDAIYRLIEATGREHLGQIGGSPIPHSHNDAPRVGIDWAANDGNAMGRYIEKYVYDAVGNFLEMQHIGSNPVNPGWNRSYDYSETSLIEDGTGGTLVKSSNRLSSTTVGNGISIAENYLHDAHGNMTRMPHLGGSAPDPNMHWDYRDQLCQTDLGGGGTAYYVYDASGQRVRKVWEKSAGLVEERIYLGGFEIYRRRQGAERLERETLHIMDDQQRVALVEIRTLDTAGTDLAPPQLIRYQFGNHLGSASLELDDQAQIISYEEYTPYGSTSYQAVRSQTETAKRYRYTGKERDAETELSYHSARYYAPWLGGWASCDPAGLADGLNLYRYSRNMPVLLSDPNGMDPPDPRLFSTFDEFVASSPSPYSNEYLREFWDAARPASQQSAVVTRIPYRNPLPPGGLPVPGEDYGPVTPLTEDTERPPSMDPETAEQREQGRPASPPPSDDYRFEILVGGPYTRAGEEHPYGHVALRVVTPTSETVYDYGRYGATWGTFGSQGEGILNVWSSAQNYIRGENALGRTTTGFSFNVTQQQAQTIQDDFSSLTAGRTPSLTRGSMQRYRIAADYDALLCNCTTITLDPVENALPGFQSAATSFIQGQGMSWVERQAARASGWPQRLFMPADLKSYLESSEFSGRLSTWGLSPPTVSTYRSGQGQRRGP